MQLKFYDEVDPEQVNLINLISHGEPADARTIARIRRKDPFCSPWFRMYAVEGDKVVAQVGAQYPIIETAEGTVKAGFIEAVAGMPSFARHGYAKALMKRVHGQMLDDGVEVFMLTTSKTLVAYSMYPKLGYHDIAPFNWGIKRWSKQPPSAVDIKVRTHAVDSGDALFRRFSRGHMGFVHRPKNYPKLKCSWGQHYSKAVSFSQDGKPIGYAYVRQPEGFLNVRELVCADQADCGPCLRALENKFPSRYVTHSIMTRGDVAREFTGHGFRQGDSWAVTMAMDARGKLSQAGVKKLLGIDRDRFQMFTLDTY